MSGENHVVDKPAKREAKPMVLDSARILMCVLRGELLLESPELWLLERAGYVVGVWPHEGGVLITDKGRKFLEEYVSAHPTDSKGEQPELF